MDEYLDYPTKVQFLSLGYGGATLSLVMEIIIRIATDQAARLQYYAASKSNHFPLFMYTNL